MRRWRQGLILAAGLCSQACGGPDPTCSGAAPESLADLQASILTPTCATAACHRGDRPAQQLNLEEGKSYASLLGRKSTLDGSRDLVKPQDPASSVLYTQVHSGLMPQGSSPLSAEQQQKVHDWICSGAPNSP